MTLHKIAIKIFLAATILVLAACTPQPAVEPTPPAAQPPESVPTQMPSAGSPLTGTRWTLVSLGSEGSETPVVAGSTVNLEFGPDGKVTGSGGCNSYSSQAAVEGASISFAPVISTKMACAGAGITQQEQQYFQALESASAFEIANDQLIIRSNDGKSALAFAPAEAPGKPSGYEGVVAGTQWRLVSFGAAGAEEPVVQGSLVTLEFDNLGQAGGSGGCNRWGSPYTVTETGISFGEIIQTERACTDESLMTQEQNYFQALKTAETFKIADDVLTITYDGGQGALTFQRGSGPGVTP